MMSSSVTSLVEEKEADVDGAKGVGGAAVLDRLERVGLLVLGTSWAGGSDHEFVWTPVVAFYDA